MRTLAVLPIKSFGAAKQRLSGLLGGGSRKALAQAMFLDVLAALRRVEGLDSVAVVTADSQAEWAAHGEGVEVLLDKQERGQSHAVSIGIRHGVERGFERVLLVPGDTPLIEPREVAAMLQRAEHEEAGVVMVPDRHGVGTNALLITPPQAMEPSFGPGSLERHRALAAAGGLAHRIEAVPSLLLDVDTPEDLAQLAELLGERRGQACMTRGALRQLDRSNVRRTVRHATPREPVVQIQA